MNDRENQPDNDNTSKEIVFRSQLAAESSKNSSTLIEEVIRYPEGGFRGWATVFGSFLLQFCGFGYSGAFGVYQDYYTRVYMTKYSPSTISWIGGINAFLLISMGILCGRLYDKGYFHFLLYGGVLLTSFFLFMLSLVKPNQFVEAFLCQGIGVGLGGGLLYVPSLAIVSHYFDKKRAIAMGIVTAGASLGAALIPIMMNNLFQIHSLGFGGATRINAGFMTGLLFLACVLIRPGQAPPKQHADLRNCLKRFVRDSAYITVTVGYTLFAFVIFFPMFYLQLAAITRGLNKNFAFYSLMILNLCGFVSRMSCGYIGRIIDVRYQAILSAAVSGCICFAFVAAGSPAAIVLIGVLYGISSGIYVGMMGPLMSLVADNAAELGIRIGISFGISGLGELLGPPIIGTLLTGEYLWWRPAVFAGVLALGSSLCFSLAAAVLFRREKGVRARAGVCGNV